jgi:hypothetical protein
MELPTTKVTTTLDYPKAMVLYGATKIGKTTMLSMLENTLIIDTESGTDYVEALKVKVNNLQELQQVGAAIKNSDHKYYAVAIDTIDRVVEWCENKCLAQYNKDLNTRFSDIGQIPYGGGYGLVRTEVMSWISRFKAVTDRLIIIGHRKKSIIGESSVEVVATSLDLPGKLRNILSADMDAVGSVLRDDKGNLKISFKTEEDIEVGSRCKHLRGKLIDFRWDLIYPDLKK